MAFNPRYSFPDFARVWEVGGKPEQPAEFMKRLKREYGEGAWSEFRVRRDALHMELKGAGEKEAYWTAHAQLAKDYPPLGGPVEDAAMEPVPYDGPVIERRDVDTLKSLSSLLPKDMLWLHRNIGQEASPDDPAPSAMAAWLWDAARSPANTAKVIDLVAKHLPSAKVMEDQAKLEDDGSSVIETLEKIAGMGQ